MLPLNIPIGLTFFRLILIPFFVIANYIPSDWSRFIATLLFVIAAITDWFDGYLARRWQQTTRFGAFLDPVADKVMVLVALALVVEHFHVWWITLPAATIMVRELVISALREWMAEIGKRNVVAVSWIGKVKTALQMLALVGLLWRANPLITDLGIAALYIATFLTFWSMYQYLAAAKENLLEP